MIRSISSIIAVVIGALGLTASPAVAGADVWTFYGDSITKISVDPSVPDSFGAQVHAAVPAVTITQYNEGMTGMTAHKALGRIGSVIRNHPDANYVTISLGTNDANCSVTPDAYYTDMVSLAQSVLNAGKTPVVPTLPSAGGGVQCGIPIRDAILRVQQYPGVVAGPDLWAHFQVGPDGTEASRTQQQIDWFPDIHPSTSGKVEYRRFWAEWAVNTIYAPPPAA